MKKNKLLNIYTLIIMYCIAVILRLTIVETHILHNSIIPTTEAFIYTCMHTCIALICTYKVLSILTEASYNNLFKIGEDE